MKEEKIKSVAFQNEELRSERLRIFGVLSFVALFLAVTAVRLFVIRTASGATPWAWSFFLGAIVIAYELWTLRKVDGALKANGSLPLQFWILSTILETSIPAFAIIFLNTQLDAIYRLLASPAVLAFFIFIILSTLRLNPWICVLSGTVAATTYLFACWHLGWRPPVPGIPAPITQSNVSLNAIILFVGGLVADAAILHTCYATFMVAESLSNR